MSLARWEPFRGLERMREEMDRLFQDVFGGGLPTAGQLRHRVPAIDLAETETDVVLTAELPGVDKKDLSLEVLPDALTLSAKTSREKEEKGETFYRRECSWGEFRRVIPLPAEVKAEGAKATLRDGVLKVTLPKTETAKAQQPKKIEIG